MNLGAVPGKYAKKTLRVVGDVKQPLYLMSIYVPSTVYDATTAER